MSEFDYDGFHNFLYRGGEYEMGRKFLKPDVVAGVDGEENQTTADSVINSPQALIDETLWEAELNDKAEEE